jgi:hypothetical protein
MAAAEPEEWEHAAAAAVYLAGVLVSSKALVTQVQAELFP